MNLDDVLMLQLCRYPDLLIKLLKHVPFLQFLLRELFESEQFFTVSRLVHNPECSFSLHYYGCTIGFQSVKSDTLGLDILILQLLQNSLKLVIVFRKADVEFLNIC